jgi:NTP pyrophosphatase (non-canonical NTP hydrolase)
MEGYKNGGYKRKYDIRKSDGSDVDPKADYFVLRIDKDPHARVALLNYARSVRKDNEELYWDIINRLQGMYDADVQAIGSVNYVEHVLRTESIDFDAIRKRVGENATLRLLHAVLGLVTESAELADMLKKHIFYGKELDIVNAKEEIGDSMWYVGLAVDILSTTMDDIMTKNIDKLAKRYPDKFSEHAALNRDIENEMSHFKGDE